MKMKLQPFGVPLVLMLAASSIAAANDRLRVDPYTMLPQPMREAELEDFAAILTLSEAQESVMDALFLDYTEAMRAIAPRMVELNRREASRRSTGTVVRGEFVQREPQLTIHERYEEARKILESARPLESTMIQLEDEFFNSVAAMLAEPQLESLYRAQQARMRMRYRVMTDALPGAQVDVITLVAQLGLDMREHEAADDMLAAYEQRLVPLLRMRHEAQKRVHLGDLRWLSKHDGVRIDAAALSERGRIRARQMRLESSLRRLNLATLEALTIVFDESEATDLLDAFYQHAHPGWRQDSDVERTRAVLEAALARDDFEDDVMSEIEYLHESFVANHRRLQRRLSDAEFKFRERLDRTLSAHVDDMAAHDAEMRAIREQREALCERTISSVEELLSHLDTTDDPPVSR